MDQLDDLRAQFIQVCEDAHLSVWQVDQYLKFGNFKLETALNYYFTHLSKGKVIKEQIPQTSTVRRSNPIRQSNEDKNNQDIKQNNEVKNQNNQAIRKDNQAINKDSHLLNQINQAKNNNQENKDFVQENNNTFEDFSYPLNIGEIILPAQYIPINQNMRLLVGDPIDLRVETTRKNVKKKYVESSSIRLFKDNREVGKLGQDFSDMLCPLMINKLIFVENSQIKQSPQTYSPFSSFEIKLDIYLSHNSIISHESSEEKKELLHRNRSAFQQLFKQLNKIEETKICEQKSLESLMNSMNHIDLTPEQMVQPSENLLTKLFPFQLQALNWMLDQESFLNKRSRNKSYLPQPWVQIQVNQGCLFYNTLTAQIQESHPQQDYMRKGGILSDDMGLGKTLMTLSLILTHTDDDQIRSVSKKSEEAQEKYLGTLIVVPLSLMAQWQKEIDRHAKKKSLKYCEYYGEDRQFIKLNKYDLVFTTYNILQIEHSKKGPLYMVNWFRVVLDEAHAIKNQQTLQAKACFAVNSKYRWCLTGTPIQNKIEDLYSYFHFIRFEPFDKLSFFTQNIVKPFEQNDANFQMKLHTILNSVLLRRTKKQVELQITLPNKEIKIHYVKLNDKEKQEYEKLFIRQKNQLDEELTKNTVNFIHIFSKISKLRMFCDNPFLIQNKSYVGNIEQTIKQFIDKRKAQKISDEKELTETYFDNVIENIKKKEIEQCCICYDSIEDACITICLHIMCRYCLFRTLENYQSCPECRSKISKRDILTLPMYLIQYREKVSIKKDQVISSSKQEALIYHVQKVVEKKEKCVIFSQFLGMMDLVAQDLQKLKISYEVKKQSKRIDGKVKKTQRQAILHTFSEENVTVLMVSLKSGGTGLNLTAANHAFLLDPWWNEAIEDQAIDRIYRIGQTKEVSVVRFVCENTIENRMIELQQKKKEIIDMAFKKNDKQVTSRIEEIKKLLQTY